MRKNDAVAVGDFVHSMLWPDAVVVALDDAGGMTVEAWGYGRVLGPVRRAQWARDDASGVRMTREDARHWFRVAVDARVRMYGDQARPVSDVARDLYAQALDDAEKRAERATVQYDCGHE